MKIKLSILTIMAVCATVPACADPYTVKVNPPICETTVVSRVYHAGPPGDGFTGNSRCGACASGYRLCEWERPIGRIFIRPGHGALPRWR